MLKKFWYSIFATCLSIILFGLVTNQAGMYMVTSWYSTLNNNFFVPLPKSDIVLFDVCINSAIPPRRYLKTLFSAIERSQPKVLLITGFQYSSIIDSALMSEFHETKVVLERIHLSNDQRSGIYYADPNWNIVLADNTNKPIMMYYPLNNPDVNDKRFEPALTTVLAIRGIPQSSFQFKARTAA